MISGGAWRTSAASAAEEPSTTAHTQDDRTLGIAEFIASLPCGPRTGYIRSRPRGQGESRAGLPSTSPRRRDDGALLPERAVSLDAAAHGHDLRRRVELPRHLPAKPDQRRTSPATGEVVHDPLRETAARIDEDQRHDLHPVSDLRHL